MAEPITRRALEEKIVARAWKDEGFRKAFLADPKKQFEERLGTKLPSNLTITAHAEDADHLHFVIPAKPGATVGELSDEQLEKVAGGVTPISIVTAVAAVAGLISSGFGIDAENRQAGKASWT
jgi:hypothetical protein